MYEVSNDRSFVVTTSIHGAHVRPAAFVLQRFVDHMDFRLVELSWKPPEVGKKHGGALLLHVDGDWRISEVRAYLESALGVSILTQALTV